jgi:threonine/homoserine/homoserine lactone efflux protein
MDFTQTLLALAAIHVVAIISPGPEFLLISRKTLVQGKAAGFQCLFGTLIGQFIHIGYSAFGIAELVSGSLQALWVIKIVGGAYLIYLGVSALKSRPTNSDETAPPTDATSGSRSIWEGFLCDLLNPKATLYYVSIFTFFLSPDLSTTEFSLSIALMFFIHIVWFVLVIVLLTIPRINQLYKNFTVWIDRLLGSAMLAIGLRIMFSRVQ